MNHYYILKEYERNLMYIEDILKTSSTTNNFQLEKVCKNIFGNLFLGVFTADKYPNHISNGEMFIINNRKNKGEHWVSVTNIIIKCAHMILSIETFIKYQYFGRTIIGYQQIKIEINHIMKMIVDKGVYVGKFLFINMELK